MEVLSLPLPTTQVSTGNNQIFLSPGCTVSISKIQIISIKPKALLAQINNRTESKQEKNTVQAPIDTWYILADTIFSMMRKAHGQPGGFLPGAEEANFAAYSLAKGYDLLRPSLFLDTN